MSVTEPTDVNSSIPEVWAKDTMREHLRRGFWGPFIGSEGEGKILVQKTELLNGPGDLIHIQTTGPLAGAGVSGDTATLEGNEEKLTSSEFQLQPLLRRHAVRVNRRAKKKSIIDLREEAKMRLAEWGEAKMDSVRFSQFVSEDEADVVDATYTPNRFQKTGTDDDDILSTDKLTVDLIRKLKVRLMVQKAKPFRMNGLEFYVAVIHPYQTYDLKSDSAYNSAVSDAHTRGSDNPIFTGAISSIDGVVLFEHFSVPTATNTGSVQYAKSLAFGQEAFVEALDENAHWNEDTFDYGKEWGIAYEFAFQPRRALELASIQVRLAAGTV